MKKALVVNCSAPHYNVGACKLADWLPTQGYDVEYANGDPGLWGLDVDLVCLSVIFSWHALLARDIALRMKDRAQVWCGGPGIFALVNWWRNQTGLEIVKGLDSRFEKQRGDYKMTFASRGCPVNCSFCIVPRLEGITFSFDPDFQPAPVLCDNNLSALPVDYQEQVGYTKGGLVVLQQLPEDMPLPLPALGAQLPLFAEVKTGDQIWQP